MQTVNGFRKPTKLIRILRIIEVKTMLPPAVKKIGFYLLDDEYLTIPYVIDTIQNSPAGHQIPT